MRAVPDEVGTRTGSRERFVAVFRERYRDLYGLAYRLLGDHGEAEDVVQETYVRAFTHLNDFRGDSSLSTWLSRIAMNEALGRLRRQRPGVELCSLPQGALEAQIIQFPLVSAADDPEKSMAQREIQLVVEGAIDELPEPFRIVFIARVLEGMNVEETAEILELKPETVKTRLHRARTMLRDNVEKKIGPVIMDAFPFAGRRCDVESSMESAFRRLLRGRRLLLLHAGEVLRRQHCHALVAVGRGAGFRTRLLAGGCDR